MLVDSAYLTERGFDIRKSLVTGEAGFVGRLVVHRLLERGDEVHCVDNVAPLTGGLMPAQWSLFDPQSYAGFKWHHPNCRTWFKEHQDTDLDYVLQFASMAAKACGYEPEVTGMSDTPEGVFARGGDTTRQEALGFRYAIDFEDGVTRAIAHYEATSR